MDNPEVGARLAAIVRDVQSGDGVAQVTEEICLAAVELLGNAVGAGISLVHRRRSVQTAAATSAIVRDGDRMQYELQQGPCLDALWDQEQVYAGDLPNDDRWPRWGPRITAEHGVHSMLCTRLFTHEDRVGALNVYATERFAFDTEDAETARLLAVHAAVAVAAAQEIENLKVAVDRRTTIGKALGIVMARYGLGDDQALAVLRRLSSDSNRKLYDVAVSIVHDQQLPEELEA